MRLRRVPARRRGGVEHWHACGGGLGFGLAALELDVEVEEVDEPRVAQHRRAELVEAEPPIGRVACVCVACVRACVCMRVRVRVCLCAFMCARACESVGACMYAQRH